MTDSKKQDYQIISLIGNGAYGYVYKARKKMTGQFVAIKTIQKKGKAEKDIKAMREEIDILKKLKHENIILLLDSFESPKQFVLVTELGQGELFNIIEDDGHLELAELRKVAQQLVRALHYLHSNRVTHRDMKPQNVLMTSDGVVKLCDFGFARSMSHKTEFLSSLKGTPLYMAPQVVLEEPYNHAADLWSLGVILYELFVGEPPFSASNLIGLVDRISKDPVHYPDEIKGDFKNFLKGLLSKDPKRRLGWPELLHHPFIKETEEEKAQRKRKTQKFTIWVEDNAIGMEENNVKANPNLTSKYVPGASGDERSGYKERSNSTYKDNSGQNIQLQCSSDVWNKYLSLSNDEKRCQELRSDQKFLEALLEVFNTNINEIIRMKEKRQTLSAAVKSLISVLMKSKPPKQASIPDIAKNINIPDRLLNILSNLLKIDSGKMFVDINSDVIKLIGILAKITFQKSLGVEMVYIRSLIPILPLMVKSACANSTAPHQTFINNLLRTVGMFINNASTNSLKSFAFYRDLVEVKFIQQSTEIQKQFHDSIGVLKLHMQVFSALMHPVHGDIEYFPWHKTSSGSLTEFKEFYTMSECVRQSVISTLMENNWVELFEKIIETESQETTLLHKVSLLRIILQSIRFSKDFTHALLHDSRYIFKFILSCLTHEDSIIYSTSASIVSQCLKFLRERDSLKMIQNEVPFLVEAVISSVEHFELNANQNKLTVYASFLLLFEVLNCGFPDSQRQILTLFLKDKPYLLIASLLDEFDQSKLEEMRKMEGSDYGIHSVGFYDTSFMILHKINVLLFEIQTTFEAKIQVSGGEPTKKFCSKVVANKIPQKLCKVMERLSSKSDISPRGFVSYLIFVNDLINNNIVDSFVQPIFLENLIEVLKQNRIERILDWPADFGGGQGCLTVIFGNLSKIILALLKIPDVQSKVQNAIYQSNFIQYTVSFAQFLDKENISSVISMFGHLVNLDKAEKHEKLEKSFAHEFIKCGGMSLFSRFDLLNKQNYEASSLIESCHFLTLMARASKEFYPHIDSISPFEHIVKLIQHQDSQVRAKALNLIGNLCRHSNYFYKKLAEFGIISLCIKACQEQDKTIKKFACVSIGNASFHDDSLYQLLRPCVAILVGLIKDSEEKTRSNAAAALGNLARNSHILDSDFKKTGANFQLVNMIVNEKSVSCKKICVMAVMNLIALPESHKILLEQNIEAILKKFTSPHSKVDPGLAKTCEKALDKLHLMNKQESENLP